MKIVVMGAGAIGGFVGARLYAAGEDVSLIARGEHLKAIQRDGLFVKSPNGDFHLADVPATDNPESLGTADVVLFLVKLYDTAAAIEAIRPIVGDHTMVLTLQNGISARDELTEAFGPARVAGGSAYISADVEAPGVIRHASEFARLVYGPFEGSARAPLERLKLALEGAGIEVDFAEDASRRLWEKFVFVSAFAGITALTRLPAGRINADPLAAKLLMDAFAEALAVARFYEPAIGEDFVAEVMERVVISHPKLRSSMLEDLNRGKRLEVMELSGRIVELGRAHGVPTPVHSTVVSALSPWRDGASAGA